MKLSTRERDILCAAQLRPDATMAELRNLTGYREHSIRYVLQKASEQGITERRCFMNLFRLGFTQYEIYFSLASEKKDTRAKVLAALAQSDMVSWAGELGGDYHYGLNVCARHISELSNFLDGLSQQLNLVYLDKAVAARLSLSFFGNKYLSKKIPTGAVLAYQANAGTVAIDEVDHRILSALAKHLPNSRRELSRLLALPFSTLEYRLRKLSEADIIKGFYYNLKPEALGAQTFLLLVTSKGFNQKLKTKFHEFCKNHPQISILIESIGSWDFEIAAEVENPRHALGLTQELHDAFSANIHSVKVLPCFGYTKVCEYPFDSVTSLRIP
jgi:DNA-binding Lrp family transcriptional regulator